MSTPDDSAPRPPSPGDDLDPELVNLRKTRQGIGPVLALSVVALAGYVMLLLLPDLRYWAGAKAPREVASPAGLAPNDYVTVMATPDRALASRLRARQDIGRRLVPVMGSSRGFWLELEGDAVAARAAYDERYTGRVRRVADLGFVDELTAFVAAMPPHPHFIDPAQLAGAVPKDLAGDAVAVAPETPTELEEKLVGRARVTVILTDTLADVTKARAALAAALAADPGEPTLSAESYWQWEVDGDVPALAAKIAEAHLFAASVDPVFVTRAAAWKDVVAGADAVTIGGRAIPRPAIVRASVLVPERLPADALILVAGDVPEAYWYVPIVFSALGLLSLLTIWAFVRTVVGTKGKSS